MCAAKLVEGHCLCNAHKFEVEARFVRFGFASCHCSICRAAHAAPVTMWSGLNAQYSTPDIFRIESVEGASLTAFRSSSCCTRYFCSTCGTHVYIKYDDASTCSGSWAGEVHFPTALVDEKSLEHLEEVVKEAGRPRYLHVFWSDRHKCMGDLAQWAAAPKYGGQTGLEPMD